MDERLQDRIDAYILERMSAEERKTFEDDLAKDAKLREQYCYTKIVKEAICQQAEVRKLMDDFDAALEEERRYDSRNRVACMPRQEGRQSTKSACYACPAPEAKPPRGRGRKVLLWITGIAAILVVGVFVVDLFFMPDENPYDSIRFSRSPDSTINEYAPSLNDSRTGAARGSDDLELIDKLIADKEYDKALALIEDAEQEMEQTIYNDLMYKKFENYGEEENEHEEYEKRELQQRKDDLDWMKANALIGLGRKQEALVILNQLRKGNGEYKSRANVLFNKIFKK